MFLLILEVHPAFQDERAFTFQYVSINTFPVRPCFWLLWCFTFQYVSINTMIWLTVIALLCTLHSNMFLLIPSFNVGDLVPFYPLHSNMFLLIRNHSFQMRLYALIFTFQYVSINTRTLTGDIVVLT